MKKIIRLTEGELRNIIKNSVGRILGEAAGYVPSDGNYMTGGRYDSWDTYGYYDILDDFINEINKECYDDYEIEELEHFYDYVDENAHLFNLAADIEASYDESTGYGSAYSPIYEIKNIDGVDEIISYLKNYDGDKTLAERSAEIFENMIKNVDAGEFQIDDADDDYDDDRDEF